MVSPLLRWDHAYSWSVPNDNDFQNEKEHENMEFIIDSSPSTPLHYLNHHVIDELALVPASAYLVFVWQTLADMLGQNYETLAVIFENVHFKRAVSIPNSGQFYVS